MICLVTYDIAEDGRREAVSRVLSTFGARVQLSVFECEGLDHDALAALRRRVEALIDVDEDQIRFYPLPADAVADVAIVGNRRLEERADFYIV